MLCGKGKWNCYLIMFVYWMYMLWDEIENKILNGIGMDRKWERGGWLGIGKGVGRKWEGMDGKWKRLDGKL